ncbi:MAG TPA: UDP-N-acetylmuramoyl-tripeptide--D-alanyl-D-alanine ligase [Clostridiaceae bacterium]|nr:UDP-N-acetylmuramoyl-tripeptide--D-alanyl-D-alanine ligase [Clostridiaceae bacterium]
MLALKCSEILAAVRGVLLNGTPDAEITGVSIDSRKIMDGDLFIPIKGERYDGHDFIEQAVNSGAKAVLTSKDIKIDGGSIVVIKVNDTKKALGDLAAYYRSKFNIPFIGITGSVGKTSTKEMVACVLGQHLNTLKTMGNYNNEIGLPLSVLNLDSRYQAAVFEMGMNSFGEISRLTSIVKPDVAIITNIGMAHIEKLGSRQNILKAKLEILEGLSKEGLVILNGDDKLLSGMRGLLGFRTKYFGTEEEVDYKAENIRLAGEKGSYFEIRIDGVDYEIYVPAPGIHNVYNALAAIASGIELNIPVDDIIKGIREYKPEKMRLNIIELKDIKIIDDTYNANPQSMEAALNVLKDVAGNSRKIAVLGDMLEMGEWADQAHYGIGKLAFSKGINYIITVGNNAKKIAEGALNSGANPENVKTFENNAQGWNYLKELIMSGDVILVKGSRSMKMEEIVNKLMTDRNTIQ